MVNALVGPVPVEEVPPGGCDGEVYEAGGHGDEPVRMARATMRLDR